MVLDVLPRRRWAELAGSRIDPDMVFGTAQQMNKELREKGNLCLA
ncbi:MAG: hypothetical protein ABI767_04445 [Rhodanobacter sp.]